MDEQTRHNANNISQFNDEYEDYNYDTDYQHKYEALNDDTGESQTTRNALHDPFVEMEPAQSYGTPGNGYDIPAMHTPTSNTDTFPVTPRQYEEPHAVHSDEFTNVFDIVDGLMNDLQEQRPTLLSTSKITVNRDELLEICQTLKNLLPVQLERASSLMRESEHRLEQAQHESDNIIHTAQAQAQEIINQAQERAMELAGQQNVVAIANERAEKILQTAQQRAEHLELQANEYSKDTLNVLQEQVQKISVSIANGLDVLERRSQR